MFCPFCGSEVPDSVRFCPSCGGDVAAEIDAEKTQKRQQPAQASQQQPASSAAAPISTELTSAQKREIGLAQATSEGLGMGWYKFMIYFQLFAGAVIDIIVGLSVMSISRLGSEYGTPSSFSAIFVFMGVFYIAFGIFYIYCRTLMARFSTKAITTLYIVYGVNIAVSVLGLIGSTRSGSSPTSTMTNLGATIVLLVINMSYFKKRAHLFVND
ncbi:MAG: zinc ribbon domain-containing protein [Atopobiaceae bacterium]|nr:zinc ribbon domain-containing protein [Atopobiaceae bacterium]